MNLIVVVSILTAMVFAPVTSQTSEAKTTAMQIFRKFDIPAETAIDNIRYHIIRYISSLWRKFNKTTYNVSDLNTITTFKNIFFKIQEAEKITKPDDMELFDRSYPFAFFHAEYAKLTQLYKNFMKFYQIYTKHLKNGKRSWISYSNYFNEPNIGISDSMKIIQTYLATDKEIKNLYLLIQKQIKYDTCKIKQSPYQALYNFHNIISVLELKSFVLMQFGYMTLTLFNQGNHKPAAKLVIEAFEESTRQRISKVKSILLATERSYYLCDPEEHKENVTYSQLTKLMQGYIENEKSMAHNGKCIKTCAVFDKARFFNCNSKKKEFCEYQKNCRGKIFNCGFKTPEMTVCVSKDPSRRYDWVDYDEGRILGKKTYCDEEQTHSISSWEEEHTDCDYCFCYCDDGIWESDRFFNLRDVTSDLKDNKVVTGLRIIKIQRIIHLQIQQGILLPRGLIEANSTSWKPVDAYSIEQLNLTSGVDYEILTTRERGINLNEFVAPSEYAVTGVRFRKTNLYISLGVRITPINYQTGNVSTELRSTWLTNWKYPSGQIQLYKPDIPTRNGPHLGIQWPNSYVNFQPTDFEKDLAQTTVPFFDSQEISMDHPLSGVGLFYRGKRGSGGFIAPKLITYDFGHHLAFD